MINSAVISNVGDIPMTVTDIIMNTDMNNKYLTLLQCLDPLFPTGGYTLSNGMETYTQKGIVDSAETLTEHLISYLYMLSFNELAFAARSASGGSLEQLGELLTALKAPSELRNGSIRQGTRCMKLITKFADCPKLSEYSTLTASGKCHGHHCIAVGALIHDTGTDASDGLCLYSYSLLSSMANHAAKLVPLRQLDAQSALSQALKLVPSAAERAISLPCDELGSSFCGFDIRSMQHETLFSRLYIS